MRRPRCDMGCAGGVGPVARTNRGSVSREGLLLGARFSCRAGRGGHDGLLSVQPGQCAAAQPPASAAAIGRGEAQHGLPMGRQLGRPFATAAWGLPRRRRSPGLAAFVVRAAAKEGEQMPRPGGLCGRCGQAGLSRARGRPGLAVPPPAAGRPAQWAARESSACLPGLPALGNSSSPAQRRWTGRGTWRPSSWPLWLRLCCLVQPWRPRAPQWAPPPIP